ncbi:MAG: polysaccharide deacetylase family protein [bacterium]|nr:polysaccharide deacetylase family protein [bacterium]
MPRPTASLSLDLDNRWSYLKIHGDPGWEEYPSYLDIVVPRVLDFLAERDLKITFFLVGQDAALEKNRTALAAIAAAGHEIGNHSMRHEPWLHRYSSEEIDDELATAERHIEEATGRRTIGFRGPGFSSSPDILRTLARRGYAYDASSFPTFLGPLAKAYYFMTAKLSREEKRERKDLFGKFSDGFGTLKRHPIETPDGALVEVPVTTVPFVKVPFHVSYLVYIGCVSRLLAKTYFRTGLGLCRLTGVQPSILLHPLDFLGKDDGVGLDFFPGMGMESAPKVELVGEVIDLLAARFNVQTMQSHAARG